MKGAWFWLTLTAAALIACGASEHQYSRTAPYTELLSGGSDSQSEYPWIVRIVSDRGDRFQVCSGTVIGERAVLTAAHCVERAERVYVQTAGGQEARFKAAAVHIGRGYMDLPILGAYNDIAVVTTRRALGRSALPILSGARLSESDVVMVGGFGLASVEQPEGALHISKAAVTQASFQRITTQSSRAGGALCFGDSGGPLLGYIAGTGGASAGMGIAGVISSGSSPDCAPGDLAFSTAIRPHIAQILRLVPDAKLL
jgi:hypothetical protein